MLEGRSYPVSFTADASVFDDSDTQKYSLSYSDLFNLRENFVNSVNIEKGVIAEAVISYPTSVSIWGNKFIVYSGESLVIKKGQYNEFYLETKEHDKRRDAELLFFNKFKTIDKFPTFIYENNYNIDEVLLQEKILKDDISAAKISSKQRFDSLANTMGINKKFRQLAAREFANRYDFMLLYFYEVYKNILEKNGLYLNKLKAQLVLFNGIDDVEQFGPMTTAFNQYMSKLFPYKMRDIDDVETFVASYDSASSLLTGVARDYKLSMLIYRAFSHQVIVPEKFMEDYRATCKVDEYKKTIAAVEKQFNINTKNNELDGDNLLFPNGKKTIALSKLFSQNKGKIIVLDFWAHWCVPCAEDLPFFKKLMEEYKSKDIVFIRLSIDREAQPWRKAIIAEGAQKEPNYLMTKAGNSAFAKAHHIETIPRYMIINKNGEMVDDDAPGPSDVRLKVKLDSLLTNL